MSSQTQPGGITMLEASEQLTVCVGTKSPRGGFTVLSEGGEALFSSNEVLAEFEMACDGRKRRNSFYIDLLDDSKKQVISYRRPPKGTLKLQVRVGGVLVATVHQAPTFRKPILLINDARNEPVLRIKGPCSYKTKCDFDLQTLEKQSIGAITKLCGLRCQNHAHCGDAVEDYKLSFPKNLNLNCKAAVLGACFLIDFACFEESWF